MMQRKLSPLIGVLAGIAVTSGLLWLAWPASVPDAGPAKSPLPAHNAGPAPGPDVVGSATTAWPPATPGRSDGIERVPLLPVDQSASATASLAEAHLRGDPRTPPLVRAAETTAATDAERADPKAYAEYETRQNLRVLAQFSQAADQMLPQLRADIERGRQMGIAPEKIAKAEEKYRRIAEEQANILKQHPELAKAASR